ncbi:MAG: FHA domain-containing protein [Bacteroidia bacterium]|nr:FHA domain-containing protein [Bacteroidia bacterium]
MQDKETVHKEPNKFSKSVGSGMKTVFGSKGRTYYVLEHKAGSEKHRAGELQAIIIDYVELGRLPQCQVCFGETFPTVSRQHAAIYREGNSWMLKHLSKSNPTLINGRPVKDKWYLQSGDEIQLSMEGPKLGFIIPSNPFVNSIGLSRRLSLFRQQALKPYKRVLVILSVVFLIAICSAAFFIYQMNEKRKQDTAVVNKKFIESERQRITDSLGYQKAIANLKAMQERKIQDIYKELENSKIEYNERVSQIEVNFKTIKLDQNFQNIYDQFTPYVYFLQVEEFNIIQADGTSGTLDINWTGSGFLLNDGRFVTARHCIQFWRVLKQEYEEQPDLLKNILIANLTEQNGGKIIVKFKATSPKNSFTFSSDSAILNDYHDKYESIGTADDGTPIKFHILSQDNTDIAYIPTMLKESKLQSDTDLSNRLEAMQKVIVLGYSYGNDLQSTGTLYPLMSESKVAQPRLVNGLINLSDRNFGPGCSGGPVITEKDNTYYVVGVVSAGLGSEIGIIVPISAIK